MTVQDNLDEGRWRSLCERFTVIKLRAYRNDLAADWHDLADAEPGTPGLLEKWELLEEHIAEVDEFVDEQVTRGCEDPVSEDEDDGDWAEARDYRCPVGRCSRRVSASSRNTPHCNLFRLPMTQS